jgi:hypothetical protein
MRIAKALSDVEALLVWAEWIKLQDPSEADTEMAISVRNVCSQVNNWKAKFERADASLRAADELAEAFEAVLAKADRGSQRFGIHALTAYRKARGAR